MHARKEKPVKNKDDVSLNTIYLKFQPLYAKYEKKNDNSKVLERMKNDIDKDCKDVNITITSLKSQSKYANTELGKLRAAIISELHNQKPALSASRSKKTPAPKAQKTSSSVNVQDRKSVVPVALLKVPVTETHNASHSRPISYAETAALIQARIDQLTPEKTKKLAQEPKVEPESQPELKSELQPVIPAYSLQLNPLLLSALPLTSEKKDEKKVDEKQIIEGELNREAVLEKTQTVIKKNDEDLKSSDDVILEAQKRASEIQKMSAYDVITELKKQQPEPQQPVPQQLVSQAVIKPKKVQLDSLPLSALPLTTSVEENKDEKKDEKKADDKQAIEEKSTREAKLKELKTVIDNFDKNYFDDAQKKHYFFSSVPNPEKTTIFKEIRQLFADSKQVGKSAHLIADELQKKINEIILARRKEDNFKKILDETYIKLEEFNSITSQCVEYKKLPESKERELFYNFIVSYAQNLKYTLDAQLTLMTSLISNETVAEIQATEGVKGSRWFSPEKDLGDKIFAYIGKKYPEIVSHYCATLKSLMANGFADLLRRKSKEATKAWFISTVKAVVRMDARLAFALMSPNKLLPSKNKDDLLDAVNAEKAGWIFDEIMKKSDSVNTLSKKGL